MNSFSNTKRRPIFGPPAGAKPGPGANGTGKPGSESSSGSSSGSSSESSSGSESDSDSEGEGKMPSGPKQDTVIYSSLIWLKNPGTHLDIPYQIRLTGENDNKNKGKDSIDGKKSKYGEGEDPESQDKMEKLFSSFVPGESIDRRDLASHISSTFGLGDSVAVDKVISTLRKHQVIVDPEFSINETKYFRDQFARARHEMKTQGYSILKNMIPPIAMKAFTDFYRRLWNQFGGYSAAEKFGMQKFNWNDEPLARYYNIEFTGAVEEIMQERLVSSGLALSLWIMKGEGFPLHTDSSPPFDLTMDIVVDHEGPEHRPVTLMRRTGLFGVEEMTVSTLAIGDAILFRGSEMCHYGGDLFKRESYHNVVLWTWQYVRD